MSKRKGVTLLELLISAIIMTSVLLAVSTLFGSSRLFYYMNEDRVVISYELQYAITHIYKNVMTAIGDGSNSGVVLGLEDPPGGGNFLELTVRHIDKIDPATSPTYGDYSDDPKVAYQIDKANGKLLFDGNADGDFDDAVDESLAPKIKVTDGSFSLSGNVVTVFLKGSYNNETLTYYSACYPRLSSF